MPLDGGGPLTWRALDGGEIDVAILFSTDGVIADKGWVVLEDDKGLINADNIVPITTDEVIEAYGDDLATPSTSISAALSTGELTELNHSSTSTSSTPPTSRPPGCSPRACSADHPTRSRSAALDRNNDSRSAWAAPRRRYTVARWLHTVLWLRYIAVAMPGRRSQPVGFGGVRAHVRYHTRGFSRGSRG